MTKRIVMAILIVLQMPVVFQSEENDLMIIESTIQDEPKIVRRAIDGENFEQLMLELKERMYRISALERNATVSNESLAAIRNDQNPLLIDDMALTYDQYKALEADVDRREKLLDNKKSNRGRMAAPDFMKMPNGRWYDMPIQYLTTAISGDYLRAIIDDAIREIERKSDGCVSFLKIKMKPLTPHIFFQDEPSYRSSGTCASSPLGRKYHGNIILVSPTCQSKGHIIHEILHSLGFDHTQSRPDRDQFIKIQRDNIREDKQNNFEIFSTALDKQGPYDYKSIMHYPPKAFARDPNKNTMTPRINVAYNLKNMGQMREMSIGDVRMLKDIYCSPITSESEPCNDRITSCRLIKSVACSQRNTSKFFASAVNSCSFTCQWCDWFTVKKVQCKDLSAQCPKLAADCNSSDLKAKTVAHLACPRSCRICSQQAARSSIPNQACKDGISTCRDIKRGACAIHSNDPMFDYVLNGCKSTCQLCNKAYGSGKISGCDDFSSSCSYWARPGAYCTSGDIDKRLRVQLKCPKSCGVCA